MLEKLQRGKMRMKTFSIKEKKLSAFRTTSNTRKMAYFPYSSQQAGAIRQILKRPRLQAKLTVSAPNDAYEQEADRVADAVMRMPDGKLSRQPLEEEEEMLQTKTADLKERCPDLQGQAEKEELLQRKPSQREAYMRPTPVATEEEPEELQRSRASAPNALSSLPTYELASRPITFSLESKIRGKLRGGKPLERWQRSFFEPRFNTSFAGVRIHADPVTAFLATQLDARSFTVGHDIFFNPGEYRPHHKDGQRLLAHELTHVVQQTSATSSALAPLVQRFISPKVGKIKDLLSYGVFDWAITDAEAVEALTILARLPKVEQAEFVSDTKYLKRLRNNLPDARKLELEAIVAGVSGSVPPKKTIDEIMDKLSYGLFDWAITDREAIEALESLKKLSGDQLAVTLARINYGRLMENLPDDRKQELIDLLARGLGTGGVKEQSEQANPGTVLKSLTFNSDHGVMKDNTKDWANSGTIYPEPEWTVNAKGRMVSHPISHTKDSSITATLGLDVIPVGAKPQAIKITGTSDVPFLNFEHSGAESGGLNKTISMPSKGKLPNQVEFITDKHITWSMKWGSWKHTLGRSGPHNLFVTMGSPLNPAEVTRKRMVLAVRLVSQVGSLDPHDIVKQIMLNWTTYNLDVRYANAWELADDLATGAQCIDLVRFVQGIISTVGSPGTAEAVVIWAQPTSPTTAIESSWPHGGMSSGLISAYPGHSDWQAALLDGDFRPNNFEAALKFTHGTTKYYPGGVATVMSTPDQVLQVFTCLAWIKSVGGGKYEIMAVPASYRAGCTSGARHTW